MEKPEFAQASASLDGLFACLRLGGWERDGTIKRVKALCSSRGRGGGARICAPWARGFPQGCRVRGLCCRDSRGLVSSGSRGGSAAPSKPNSPAGSRRERERGLLHPLQNLRATRKVGIKPKQGRKMSVCLLTLLATLVYDVRNYFCHWRIVMCREAG